MSLQLRNPHAVLAALSVRPDDVLDVRVPASQVRGAWGEVVKQAQARRIPVARAPTSQPERSSKRGRSSTAGGRTGTAAALVRERPDLPLQDLFAGVEAASAGLWLALDELQDPHNVGAIFRTAAFFGVEGIVLTKDRSAPLSETVYDVASGGMEYVPFSVQPNLARALETAKQAGLWILGTAEQAEADLATVPRDRHWLVVIGNEEKGLRRLTREKCDVLCRITPRGEIRSLNASVAAGILMSALAAPPPE